MKILHIEDNEFDRLMLSEALDELNITCNILEAEEGNQALSLLKEKETIVEKNLLIILDLNMIGMDGFEFLEEVKQHPEYKKIPVFVFSTSSRKEDVSRAYSLGIAGYIVKGYSSSDFSAVANFIHEYCKIVAFPNYN